MPGCLHRAEKAEPVKPAVLVQRVKETPPADLQVCATRPEGLPASAATLPPEWREALKRIGAAFGSNADRLDRLVNWGTPGACGPPPQPG